MFGSKYVCESAFSMMKQVKCKNRNLLADGTKHWTMFFCSLEGLVTLQRCYKQQ